MKVGWVADYFIEECGGGAEIEDDNVIKEGLKRGHKIIKVRPKDKLSKKVDFYVFANIDKFNIGELLAYGAFIPYVNYEHDLRMPRKSIYPEFAGNAIVNIYHSPLHRDRIFELSGRNYKHFLLPMSLSSKFKDLGLSRKKEPVALFVGVLCKMRGYYNMVEWLEEHPLWQIDWYGGSTLSPLVQVHPRINEMGYIEHDKIVYLYNQYRNLIFLPVEIQACSRVVAESFICKVPNIISNGKDGFTSYGWTQDNYDEVKNILLNGAKIWWDVVEKEVKEW